VSRLEDVDRELAAFGKSDEVLHATIERAIAVRRALSDVDAELEAIRALDGAGTAVESRVPPGVQARPISWDEARRPSAHPPVEDGSGALDVTELRADEVPPVLSPGSDRPPLSAETALYIDPPTHPPVAASPPPEPLALEPDPELGDLSPEVPVVRPPTQPPPAPRPVPIAPPSTDTLLAEMLDQADEEPAPPPPPPPPPPPSVAENEASGAVAAFMADDRDFAALADEEEERTLMVRADALRPPAAEASDEVEDFEIDIDEDVVVLEEEDAAEAQSTKSRPPPPPPSRPPETPRSRPPEPPGKGFLSRILKGGKG
jgi:hypothetical protein